MADIRIKDLTTEAPTSLTGDFLPIDGGTGTRKLSAYSPTFGGNATVGGTLTVSGSGTSAFNGPVTITTAAGNSYLQILAPAGQSPNVQFYKNAVAQMTLGYDLTGAVSLMQLYDNVGGAVRLSVAQSTGNTTVAGTLTVSSTTASTTTSSGALVVSGGVGVAGAINAGVGTHTFGTSAGGGVNNFGALLTYFNIRSTSDSDNPIFRIYDGRVNVSAFEVNARTQVVTLPGTTASTTTSSGALVVGNGTQGGLGVGGNAYIGGDLVVPGQGKAINAQGYFLFKGAYCNIFSRGTSGGWGTGLVFHSSNTDPSASIVHDPTSGTLTLYTNATASNYSSSDIALQVLTDKQVQVKATTASTSTSSGALVVSGGVGVAKSINAGTTGADHSHVFTGGDGGSGSTIFAIKDYFGTTKFLVDGTGGIQAGGSLSLTGASNVFRIVNSQTPASASATGTAGTIAWDSSYIYVCTATNTWKRAAISTW